MPAARYPAGESCAFRPMSPKTAIVFELTDLIRTTFVVFALTGLNGTVFAVDAIPAEFPVESVMVRLCSFSTTSPG